jgi:hypothetical protein
MEETEEKKKKPHIYFKYYNIIYLFFKIQKKYKKIGETVPSRVYRVVHSRVSVLYRAVFRVLSYHIRPLNRVVPYSRKIK